MQVVELQRRIFKNSVIHIYGTGYAPLFIASELAKILKVKHSDKILAEFEDYMKETYSIDGADVMMLTEGGMHFFALESKRSVARKFRKWMVTIVLPQLRASARSAVQDDNIKYLETELKKSFVETRQITLKYKQLLESHSATLSRLETERLKAETELIRAQNESKKLDRELSILTKK